MRAAPHLLLTALLALPVAPALGEVVFEDTFDGPAATAEGKDVPIGGSGWVSHVGLEPKSLNADGSSALVIADDAKDRYFDAVSRSFDPIELAEGESLRLELTFSIGEGSWGAASIQDSRDAARFAVTDGEGEGFGVYLPGGAGSQVRLFQAENALGGSADGVSLASRVEPDTPTPLVLELTRSADGFVLGGELDGQAMEPLTLDLDEPPALSLFAATVGKANHTLSLLDATLTHRAGEAEEPE